jgi:hypothetical protein
MVAAPACAEWSCATHAPPPSALITDQPPFFNYDYEYPPLWSPRPSDRSALRQIRTGEKFSSARPRKRGNPKILISHRYCDFSKEGPNIEVSHEQLVSRLDSLSSMSTQRKPSIIVMLRPGSPRRALRDESRRRLT